MTTEYRPEILGKPAEITETDPDKGIALLENELAEMSDSLRKIRADYVRGIINDDEFKQVESAFIDRLGHHRQVLQNLRRLAKAQKQAP
jgi:hypothetical protein